MDVIQEAITWIGHEIQDPKPYRLQLETSNGQLLAVIVKGVNYRAYPLKYRLVTDKSELDIFVNPAHVIKVTVLWDDTTNSL
jgi:hypothetical protein